MEMHLPPTKPDAHKRLISLPKAAFTLGMLCFWLMACQRPTIKEVHAYLPVVSDSGWAKKDTLCFDLPDELQPGRYRLEIELRNTDEYPFRDIWLSISENLKDSLREETSYLHGHLADETGRWMNGKRAGGFFPVTFVLDKPLWIRRVSTQLRIRLTHLMQRNPLPGITDVGIRLTGTGSIHTQEDKQQNSKAPQR